MRINESPALTSVFPINATLEEKIEFIEEQIDELKQQKICYDKMIRERVKFIKKIKLNKSMVENRRGLMDALIGPRGLGRHKSRPKKKKKKAKKRRKRSN